MARTGQAKAKQMTFGEGAFRYELVDGWAKIPEGWSFTDASGLFIDASDRIYVAGRDKAHPVIVFDRDGNVLTTWGQGSFNRPHGIHVGPDGSVYVADDGNHTVTKLTPDGKPLLTLGRKDQPADTGYDPTAKTRDEKIATIKRSGPPFNRPTGVGLSKAGEIYVSDGYGNARVHKFSPDGKLLMSWGEPGTGPGQFRNPHGIAIDRDERVWIADRENSRIQIFDGQGKFLEQWANVKRPQRAWLDKDETVYVAEAWQRVSIFTRDGKLLARWGNEGRDDVDALFSAPHSIAVDSQGAIYIGEVAMSRLGINRGPRSLQKFARVS